MYVHFATKFLEAITRHRREERVKYLEYYRQGWTYHGKGLAISSAYIHTWYIVEVALSSSLEGQSPFS